MTFSFHFIYGMSSFPLTFIFFKTVIILHHQPVFFIVKPSKQKNLVNIQKTMEISTMFNKC